MKQQTLESILLAGTFALILAACPCRTAADEPFTSKFQNTDQEEGPAAGDKEKTSKGLDLKDFPITVTVIKIGNNFIVDPDSDEEKVIDARLTVASLSDGNLCARQKGGDYPLTMEDIDRMIEIALEKSKELRKYIK